ncbi:hypothetical protein EW146_g2219 [Bondarzewia mesenterica]|uniref:Uncharacterized protein n=1 Tax=Bondarzewia mesenterica TaxID=1095465 RepID=A0A4S4M371_9AGAM|nr:hypothetical protein EW146_g2219 [Bondarzewia mesenterica]
MARINIAPNLPALPVELWSYILLLVIADYLRNIILREYPQNKADSIMSLMHTTFLRKMTIEVASQVLGKEYFDEKTKPLITSIHRLAIAASTDPRKNNSHVAFSKRRESWMEALAISYGVRIYARSKVVQAVDKIWSGSFSPMTVTSLLDQTSLDLIPEDTVPVMAKEVIFSPVVDVIKTKEVVLQKAWLIGLIMDLHQARLKLCIANDSPVPQGDAHEFYQIHLPSISAFEQLLQRHSQLLPEEPQISYCILRRANFGKIIDSLTFWENKTRRSATRNFCRNFKAMMLAILTPAEQRNYEDARYREANDVKFREDYSSDDSDAPTDSSDDDSDDDWN